MALVQYGGGILDMRGSIGGQVHSKNRNGSYIRARTTPVNPQSPRQSAVRAAAAWCAARWSNDLTQANRDAWEVYAANIVRTNKLGAQIKLTGFNHFVRSNVQSKTIGAPTHDVGPVNLTLPAQDPTIVATIDEAAQQISLAFDNDLPWAKQNTGRMSVFMSLPHNVGTNFIGGPFTYADVIAGEGPGGVASPQVMPVPFIVAEGQVVKIGVVIKEEDGRVSDRFFHQSSVTA